MALTAHPLQRVGAYALACLAEAGRSEAERVDGGGGYGGLPDPGALDAAGFAAAVAAMTADAVRAATGRDTKAPAGFFLKSSLSLFPNSPMFHPSNAKRSDAEIAERVRSWRSAPPPGEPGVGTVHCVLCGEPAVGFFGKMDVPLAESDAYRNTTPRGHEGMALCWACVCCFHALPYGSRMTGGPCLALHSWDEAFLAATVAAQVEVARRVVEVGADAQGSLASREVLALLALRRHGHRLTAGVELLVFSNNNRGPTLEVYALDQALAEWLRRTARLTSLRRGFRALLRAHRSVRNPGYVELARNVFRAPARVPAACAAYLAATLGRPHRDRPDRDRGGDDVLGDDVPGELAALAALCFDFADKVMLMDVSDLEEIRATGRRIATLFDETTTAGKLREFYTRFKASKSLRSWLQRESVDWVLDPRDGRDGPLVSTRGFGLLFDPDFDNQGWFHQQMLLVAVVEALAAQGWRPRAADDDADETGGAGELPELDRQDDEFAAGGDVEGEL